MLLVAAIVCSYMTIVSQSNLPQLITAGNPVADNQNSVTVGPRGALLMQDCQLKGSAPYYGRLTIAPDATMYSKAVSS
jgi:catalase